MADKYNKVKPKVHPITIGSIALFLIIVFAVILFVGPSDSEVLYSEYQFSGYALPDDFTEEHPFVEIQYDNGFLGFSRGLEKMIEKEEIVLVFFGSETCESCVQHIGAIQKYFFEEGVDQYIDTFYYFNPANQLEEFEALTTDHPEITQTTPQIVLFKDGVAVATFQPSGTDEQSINRSVKAYFLDEVLPILNP
ncbi:MAG: hypothetical protein K9K93_07880 [Acholeplasmataceae bacterium]|nr:hypothetical protein [Acholeplasmataceae bacterium]